MSSKALFAFAALACACASPAIATAKPRYSSLTVFGDSLVDAGNIALLGLGADPAQGYLNGRFTNGYDYTDLLSIDLFGTPTTPSLLGGYNYAFGSARASTTSPAPDLIEQIAMFKAGRAADPDGLYVLNFGGTDIFAAQRSDTPAGFPSDAAFLRNAADTYAGGVQMLNDLGARHVLITGFPVATGTGLALSIEAEGYLTTALGKLTLAGGTSLFRFSYLDFYRRLTANPAAFGLAAPLIEPDAARADGGTCQGAAAYPACDRYFSFDGTHPTAAVQQAAFRDMDRQFDLTGAVPEPASWLLTIAGLGLVGAALRRRPAVRTAVRFAR